MAKQNDDFAYFFKNAKLYSALGIRMCNGHKHYSFPEAFIDFNPPIDNSSSRFQAVELQSVFPTAFTKLEPDTEAEMTAEQELAIKRLTDYFKELKTHEHCLRSMRSDQITDTEACAVLATHLFSPLIPGGHVIFKRCMKYPSNYCPCGCRKQLTKGETGIGGKLIWHGHPDLMVNQTSVVIKAVPRDEENDRDNSSVEDYNAFKQENDKDIYNRDFFCQLVSQAITNGFSQKAKLKFTNCLVPSIGCTLNDLMTTLYDPDQDILLRRRSSLPLFDTATDQLVKLSLVEIWFILNIHLFGPSMPTDIVNILKKSGVRSFFEELDVIQHYEKAVVAVDQRLFKHESDVSMDKGFFEIVE